MAKTLCKWKKADLRDGFKKYRKLVSKPRHVCKNCGRAARAQKRLCSPRALAGGA